jgi:hypothetical protein
MHLQGLVNKPTEYGVSEGNILGMRFGSNQRFNLCCCC